jgi:hypothetical protein
VDVDLPSGGGFIEPLINEVPTAKNAIRITDTTGDHVQKEASSRDKCGTAESIPPFLPCYSRQVTDSLFGKCCRESVSQNALNIIYSFIFRSPLNVVLCARMNIARMLQQKQ